eukprot:UN05126
MILIGGIRSLGDVFYAVNKSISFGSLSQRKVVKNIFNDMI